jgi:hypothetical protein
MSAKSPASSALVVIIAGVAFLFLTGMGLRLFFTGIRNHVIPEDSR